MSQGVLVAGSESGWGSVWGRVAAAVLAAAGLAVVLVAKLTALGMMLVVVAVAGLVVSEVAASARVAARRWLVDTGSGFRWHGGPDDLSVDDRQVIAVRLEHRRKHSSGLLKHVTRCFDVWLDGAAEPLRLRTRLLPGDDDPLDPLIGRLIDLLKERSAAGLADGVPLAGAGWSLDRQELSLCEGRRARVVPFGEIDKVGLFDGKICVWCRGEDAPVARIDPASRNAPVLSSLLNDWAAHQASIRPPDAMGPAAAEPAGEGSLGSGPGFGKLLFERRQRGVMWGLIAVAVIAAGAGAFLVAQPHTLPFGAIVLVLVPAAGFSAWYWGAQVFRCYEGGIVRQFGRRERRIAYTEIFEFTYTATRWFHNGVYTGTQLSMTFRSPEGRIRYAANVKVPDEDLQELRDFIGSVVARRMTAELEQGRPVAWTNDMTLLPDGLSFRRSGFLGKKPVEVLPYKQIQAVDIKEGTFYLWSAAEPKPVLHVSIATPNFFPGFFALLGQWETAREGTAGRTA